VIFLTSFDYIFIYIFCGDPKMGYNKKEEGEIGEERVGREGIY